MKPILIAAALALTAGLAACGKTETKTEAAPPAAAPASSEMSSMAGMAPAPPAATTAKGEGTVTAVAADAVTIDHGPIAEANWPAMTMAFKASPELAKSVKVGDKVAFDLKLENGGGEITAITKQ